MLKDKIKELEQEVEINTSEYNNLLHEAFKLKELCTNDMILFMKDFCKEKLEDKVKTKVKITTKLGIENLKKLKIRIHEMLLEIENEREGILNNENIWVANDNWFNRLELKEIEASSTMSWGEQSISSNVSEEMKRLTSFVGSLLNEYGFLDFKEDKDWEIKNDKVYYSHLLVANCNFDLEDKQKKYIQTFQKTFSLFKKLSKLNKDLDETKALYLWEQA